MYFVKASCARAEDSQKWSRRDEDSQSGADERKIHKIHKLMRTSWRFSKVKIRNHAYEVKIHGIHSYELKIHRIHAYELKDCKTRNHSCNQLLVLQLTLTEFLLRQERSQSPM